MLDEVKKEMKFRKDILEELDNEELIEKKIFSKDNRVYIRGQFEKELVYSHSVKWENFYKTRIKTKRDSGTEDFVPVIIPEKLISNLEEPIEGQWVELMGQFRSINRDGADGKRHLDVFLFVTLLNMNEQESYKNEIFLDAHLCKPPVYRVTKTGREITDLMLAVNRQYNRTDYIPSIAWGRSARWASDKLDVGSRVQIYGRIQSREHPKRDKESGELYYRIAYEISIQEIQEIESNK